MKARGAAFAWSCFACSRVCVCVCVMVLAESQLRVESLMPRWLFQAAEKLAKQRWTGCNHPGMGMVE